MAKQPSGPFPATASGTIALRGSTLVVTDADGADRPLRVRAGGTLTFEAPQGSPLQWWSILWKGETPFGDGKGWASEARGKKKGKRIGPNAHGNVKHGKTYAYAVVASDGQRCYFLDPEVIVGPPDET